MKPFFAGIARRRFNHIDAVGFIWFGSLLAEDHLLWAFAALLGVALVSALIELVSREMGNSL
jgi:hypothetical protein